MKKYRCWECGLIRPRVNSNHTCDRCIKTAQKEAQRNHDAIVKHLSTRY